FGVKAGVHNPELPVLSRENALARFNKGAWPVMMTVDTGEEEEAERADTRDGETGGAAEGNSSRGLDIAGLDCVLNFDLPSSATQYVHRVGRTSRGLGPKGIAISFQLPGSEGMVAEIEDMQRERYGTAQITPFSFRTDLISQFKYRVEDVSGAITKRRVTEYRAAEIKNDLIQAEKLKDYFAAHPTERKVLLGALSNPVLERQRFLSQHLTRVPQYLIPGARELSTNVPWVQDLHTSKNKRRSMRKGRKYGKGKAKNKHVARGKKKANPLKSFKLSSKRKP
ncbi:hypothetical protein KIPB_004717, partial [Kipferlia bialata]